MRPWAPRSYTSQPSFPIFTALCPAPSPSPGYHDFFGMVSSPTAPPLALLSTSHPPVITGSTVCSQPVDSERARPKSGLFTVRVQRPAQRSMAIPGAPETSHPGLGPGPGGAWHPGPHPQPGRPPFTHQGKGTQQAIPTRSPAAQYSNSWGRWEGPGIQRKE